MPPIFYHLAIAEEAASRLGHPILNQQLGSFLLGSTVPDIRFFIGASREETHFLALDSEEGASGVELMFQAYPEIIEDAAMSAATKSFVAGYLSHLVTDEAWIYQIYRPFFGKSSALRGDPTADLLDRLLQFELDRRQRLNSSSISTIREHLVDSASGVVVSFIDATSLNEWREFVSIATTRKSSREGFRAFAEKYLIWLRQIAPDRLDTFFTSFDDRLEEVLRMVPEETIHEFREQSIADSVKVVREYLE